MKNKFRIESAVTQKLGHTLLSKRNSYIRYSKADRIAITDWIKKGLGRYIAGPFEPHKCPIKLHFSPLFTVHQPNKIRTIQNLSYPKLPLSWNDLSVNNLINPAWCTISYITFREVVKMMFNAGQYAYYFMIDAVDAYYRVPVHEDDHYLMGFKWAGYVFYMTCLQMGLSSACRIYTHFSDALLYIILNNNFRIAFCNNMACLRHYLDDFFGAHPNKTAAQKLFNQTIYWFKRLGVPTNKGKCKEPCHRLVILGWKYDSVKMKVSLPQKKLDHLVPWIRSIINDPITNQQELHSLGGHLRWSSIAIFSGQAFLRRLESHLYALGVEESDFIKLDYYAIEELKWWLKQLQHAAQGIKYELILKHPADADIDVYTDAAGSLIEGGMGGWTRGYYFQIFWNETIRELIEKTRFPFGIKETDKHFIIAWLELFGAITAAYAFRHVFKNKCVRFWIDNTNAQAWIRSKSPPLHAVDCQYLIRKLADLANEYKFYFWVDRISTEDNKLADKLSRKRNLFLKGKVEKGGFKRIDVKEFVNKCFKEMKEIPPNGRLDRSIILKNKKFNKKLQYERILRRSQKTVK